tara:strand:+ start:296 stop:586 length:291 start_codon:yes stop_codon:yes gene_type:complete
MGVKMPKYRFTLEFEANEKEIEEFYMLEANEDRVASLGNNKNVILLLQKKSFSEIKKQWESYWSSRFLGKEDQDIINETELEFEFKNIKRSFKEIK